ncbi:GNAT family N-acetyltransferase [Nonomuraea sp. NPDC005692]|uniref:GNAT family N-acetyltransferase n=1 Tax=Nonomuraea sp. NPDC005692 TaxID=3157168 RepID=UPI0033CA9DC8
MTRSRATTNSDWCLRTCRPAATLADDHQGRGVGTQIFPLIADIARHFGRTRIILFGGVLVDNPRAVRYYEKHGFQLVGSFTGSDGAQSFDMILDLRPPRHDEGPTAQSYSS